MEASLCAHLRPQDARSGNGTCSDKPAAGPDVARDGNVVRDGKAAAVSQDQTAHGTDYPYDQNPEERARVARLYRSAWRMRLLVDWAPLRKLAIVGGTLASIAAIAMVALWWRLSSGPIELDLATPWLTAAIKENFGHGHQVEDWRHAA